MKGLSYSMGVSKETYVFKQLLSSVIHTGSL